MPKIVNGPIDTSPEFKEMAEHYDNTPLDKPTFSEAYLANATKYEDWLTEVDELITNLVGLGVSDLPYAPWYDCYEDGLSPREAIKEANNEWWDDQLGFAFDLDRLA